MGALFRRERAEKMIYPRYGLVNPCEVGLASPVGLSGRWSCLELSAARSHDDLTPSRLDSSCRVEARRLKWMMADRRPENSVENQPAFAL